VVHRPARWWTALKAIFEVATPGGFTIPIDLSGTQRVTPKGAYNTMLDHEPIDVDCPACGRHIVLWRARRYHRLPLDDLPPGACPCCWTLPCAVVPPLEGGCATDRMSNTNP